MTDNSSRTVRSADGTAIGYTSLGAGEGIIVVGGALRTGADYLPLAGVLARSHTVHLVDRRGRGASGPQGEDYSIDKECEDVLAIQAATGATAIFGHSYGGFVTLETARRSPVFCNVAVYEPGVSIKGSIPVSWMPAYRAHLARGDTRGAFACMVRKGGFAPGQLALMPVWYVRAILHVAIRDREWRRMEPLLGASLAEHEQEAILDDGTADRFGSISARVLLLGGQKSPAFITIDLFAKLRTAIAESTVEILDGLDHFAPDQKAPAIIGERLIRFLSSATTCAPTDARSAGTLS